MVRFAHLNRVQMRLIYLILKTYIHVIESLMPEYKTHYTHEIFRTIYK